MLADVGGVYVIALAPAWIVSQIDSSVGPPVAIIGNSGNLFLMFLTMLAVFFPPETFNIVAPASILLAISSSSEITVTMTGISIVIDRPVTLSVIRKE